MPNVCVLRSYRKYEGFWILIQVKRSLLIYGKVISQVPCDIKNNWKKWITVCAFPKGACFIWSGESHILWKLRWLKNVFKSMGLWQRLKLGQDGIWSILPSITNPKKSSTHKIFHLICQPLHVCGNRSLLLKDKTNMEPPSRKGRVRFNSSSVLS